MRLKLFLILLLAVPGFAQQPVVAGSILGSLTPITSSNGTLNAVFPVVINTGAPAVLVQLDQTTTITAGAIRFQVSYDGTNYVNVSSDAVTDPTSATNATISMPYTLVASTNKAFVVNLKGAQALQILVSTAMTGTGAITPYYSVLPSLPFLYANSNLANIAGSAVTTAATGVQKVGITGATGTALDSTAGVLDANIKNIAGSGVSTATTGVQKVGITGNAGAAFDAAGVNATAPANEVVVGAQTPSAAQSLSVSKASPLLISQAGALLTQVGGNAAKIFSSASGTGPITAQVITGSSAGYMAYTAGGVTGSPSGCIFSVNSVDPVTNGALGTGFNLTITTPSSGQSWTLSWPASNTAATYMLQVTYSCSVYPSASTFSLTLFSSQSINIAGGNGGIALVNSSGALAITQADGDDVTLGAKADAKSTATDTTAITAMQVLKEISAMEQAPASRAVTNAGTFATQSTLAAETTKVIGTVNQGTSPWVENATLQAGSAIAGKFGIDQTTPGTTNADEPVPDTASAVALTTTTKSSLTSASNVKSSAGNVYGLFASNGAAAQCWVQVINNAGAGTLGTGVIFSVPMAASGSVVIPPGTFAMANFSSGISVGIASTTNSSSACGTAGTVVLFYK